MVSGGATLHASNPAAPCTGKRDYEYAKLRTPDGGPAVAACCSGAAARAREGPAPGATRVSSSTTYNRQQRVNSGRRRGGRAARAAPRVSCAGCSQAPPISHHHACWCVAACVRANVHKRMPAHMNTCARTRGRPRSASLHARDAQAFDHKTHAHTHAQHKKRGATTQTKCGAAAAACKHRLHAKHAHAPARQGKALRTHHTTKLRE